jgi:hypothetical protein
MKKFDYTRKGSMEASMFLRSIKRMNDFWFPVSMQDIVDYANKLWDETHAQK